MEDRHEPSVPDPGPPVSTQARSPIPRSFCCTAQAHRLLNAHSFVHHCGFPDSGSASKHASKDHSSGTVPCRVTELFRILVLIDFPGIYPNGLTRILVRIPKCGLSSGDTSGISCREASSAQRGAICNQWLAVVEIEPFRIG